jgi:hypothetical protein
LHKWRPALEAVGVIFIDQAQTDEGSAASDGGEPYGSAVGVGKYSKGFWKRASPAMRLDFSNTKLDRRRPLSSYAKVQAIVSAVIRNRKAFANTKGSGCAAAEAEAPCAQQLIADSRAAGWQVGAAVDFVRAMRLSQLVRRYGYIYAGRLVCTFHHAVDGALGEPADTFPACEHGTIGAGVASSTWRTLPLIESCTRPPSRGKTLDQAKAISAETRKPPV